MVVNKLDARQTIVRDTLSHIGDGNANVEVDNLMRAINSDLYPLLRLDSNGALVITVQASSKTNPEYSRLTEIPPINGVVPSFSSGTLTFPATIAGSITVAPGTNLSLSGIISANNFVKIGVHLDSAGNLVVNAGTEGASAAAATEADFIPNTLYIGKITVSADGLGNINTIAQGDVAQFDSPKEGSQFQSYQDRSLKLISGGTWFWDQTLNINQLSWDTAAYIQIPGMEDDYNRILAGNVTLAAGEVAYVDLNRSTLATTNLTVQIAAIGSVTPDNDRLIIARRDGGDVLVGSSSFRLGADQYLELDGALPEIERKLGQLNLIADPNNLNQADILGADIEQLDGTTLSQELNNTFVDFSGANINFTTGVITGAAGTNFAPFAIPVSQYYWYGISLSAGVIGADNRLSLLVNVNPATAANVVAGSAPFPIISGTKKIGAVQVYNNAGSIEIVKVHRFGADISAPDGSGPIVTVDPASGFTMAFTDDFIVGPESTDALIRDGETNANHNLSKEMYELLCSNTPVFSKAGASSTVTLNVAPSFTVAIGDIIYVDSLGTMARITGVGSQTSFTVDNTSWTALAFAAQAGVISQAVWSDELIQRTGEVSQDTRPMDFFPNEDINICQIDYFDSDAVDDNVPDFIDQANVVISVSNEGLQGASDASLPNTSTFTPFFERAQAPDDLENYPLTANANQRRFFACFFANPNNAASVSTGQVNLIKYKASFYQQDNLIRTGGILDSAFTLANGASTEINCNAPTSEANSLLTLDFQYAQGLNLGETQGDLTVVVDGEQVPRFVSGSTTAKYFTEEPGNNRAIRFWTDVTVLGAVNIEIYRRQGSVDNADQNTIDLGYLQESSYLNFGTTLNRLRYQRILTDTSGGAFTVNLPASPLVGDRVLVQDGVASATAFNITVGRNGNLIETVAGNDILNVNREWVEYEFYGGGQGWIVRR